MSFWSGRKVLVTGGAGFIGSNLVRGLTDLGAVVRVVDNLERGRLENLGDHLSSLDFRKEDLTEPQTVTAICDGIDTVFHLASKVGGINYYMLHPGDVILRNIAIDNNMLSGAVRLGVERYVYASSTFVYPIAIQQTPDAPAIPEVAAMPADPPLSYGWAKLIGEKALEYCVKEGLLKKGALLRLEGAYGPGQDIDLERGSAIPVFIRRAIEFPERRPFVIKGKGEETRCFCYISDIVEAIIRAAEKLDTVPLLGPVNIGNEHRTTINDLATEIIRISGKQIEIEHLPATTTIWGQQAECSLARRLLDGWEPVVLLEEGLRRTFDYVYQALQEAK